MQPHCAEREISHWSQVKQKKKTALYTAETAKAGRPKLDAVLSLMQVETVKVHQGEIPTSPTITSRNKTVGGGELSLSRSQNKYLYTSRDPASRSTIFRRRTLVSE